MWLLWNNSISFSMKVCGLKSMDIMMNTWIREFQIISSITKVNNNFVGILISWIALPTKNIELNVQRITMISQYDIILLVDGKRQPYGFAFFCVTNQAQIVIQDGSHDLCVYTVCGLLHPFILRAWCKTIVTALFYITSYNIIHRIKAFHPFIFCLYCQSVAFPHIFFN